MSIKSFMLFVVVNLTMFRNSYFNNYENNPKALRKLDGWLIKSNHGISFYGIIPLNDIMHLCIKSGFKILETFQKNGSAYVIGSK